eukprot:763730-Hanusia_phi.AAC.3
MACLKGALWVLMVSGAERLAGMAMIATSCSNCRSEHELLPPSSPPSPLTGSRDPQQQFRIRCRNCLVPESSPRTSRYELLGTESLLFRNTRSCFPLPPLLPCFATPGIGCKPSRVLSRQSLDRCVFQDRVTPHPSACPMIFLSHGVSRR